VELLHTIYLIAITAEAMSGAIMGMRRGMDLFGICLLGTVTALGGGTARDVLLGHYPVGWIAHPEYLTFTIGAAIVTGFIARHLHHLRMVFLLVDASPGAVHGDRLRRGNGRWGAASGSPTRP